MTPCPAKRILLALALLGGACYAKKADDGPDPMSGTGFPVPDGGFAPDGSADLAPIPGTDGDGGRPNDLAADAGPSPQVMAYRQFLDEQWKAWSTRWTACFNAAPETLSPGRAPLYDDTPDQHTYSLEHGLVLLDQAKAKTCLEALRNMSCDWLAAESFRGVCAEALVGQVAAGGYCASPHDCQSPAEFCAQKEMHGCFSRCTPLPARAALGELCGDRSCVAGATCQMAAGAAETRCQPLAAEGASCPDRLSCAAGTWCQPATAGADPGTCRKLQAGLACQGSWQCPHAYACVIAAGAAAGSCQPGRKKGEACTLHGKDAPGGPYSDCANSLFCYPDAANQYRCGAGPELGQSCAELDVGGMLPLNVPCRVGSCRPDAAGKRICQPEQKAGGACSNEIPCEAGLGCLEGKCADPVVAVGARCTSDGTYSCPWGARCAISPVSPTQGTCTRLKKIGEVCSGPEECETGASCTGGVCAGCK